MVPRLEDTDFVLARHRMVEEQIRGRGIADEHVLAAMETVPRHLFVPEKSRWAAYEDRVESRRKIATIKYPDRYSLKTDQDRIDEATSRAVPSGWSAA